MTKAQARAVNARLRALRRERRDWLTGKAIRDWWGLPWCTGPANPYHQEPASEGCGVTAWGRDRAAGIGEQIRQLEVSLTPQIQEVFW